MKAKHIIALLMSAIMIFTLFAGCSGSKENESTNPTTESEDPTFNIGIVDNGDSNSSSQNSSDNGGENNNEGDNNANNDGTNKTTNNVQPTEKESVKVTIPEGYSFMQIANTLEKKGVCTAKAFYNAAQSYKVNSFTIPSSSNRCFKLEGYLFPDTYEFYKNDDPVSVIRKMLNNYRAKSGMPTDRQLIIASIIEKEVRSDSHMKMVSSVFYNRIEKGMRLQADSTREYVNEYITGNSLLGDTSKYAALYNTYKCELPAGPICSPGARAIAAAKSPASSDYLYFFFGNDNQNHYSKTLEEHNQQMKQYGVQYGN